MPISKIIKSPTGVLISYHEIHKLETAPDFLHATIYVRGYSSQEDKESGKPVAWMWTLSAPLEAITSLDRGTLEKLLISDVDSPLFDGTFIPAETEIHRLKREKKQYIKYTRDAIEFGGFAWNGYQFDSDQISQQRLSQACQQALQAKLTNQEFSRNWTLSSGEILENITADQMLDICRTLADYVNSLHTRSQELYRQIDLAETKEQLEQIAW